MNRGSICDITMAGKTITQKLAVECQQELLWERDVGNSHSEDTELKLANAISELEEGEGHEEGDTAANEQPSEDIFGRSPQGDCVSGTDEAELGEERSGV
jgi:hypothetical protein